MAQKTWILIFIAAALSGCGGASHPPASVAREFMEAYYVKADLGSASSLADGLALEKIRSSEKLRGGTEGGVPAAAHGRRVSFKLAESKVEGASGTYLYRVEIKPEGTASVRKKTLLRVRQDGAGAWKVTQFTDYEDEG